MACMCSCSPFSLHTHNLISHYLYNLHWTPGHKTLIQLPSWFYSSFFKFIFLLKKYIFFMVCFQSHLQNQLFYAWSKIVCRLWSYFYVPQEKSNTRTILNILSVEIGIGLFLCLYLRFSFCFLSSGSFLFVEFMAL